MFTKIADRMIQHPQNVFDEMVMNEARLLKKSENICNVYSAKLYYNYLTMEYKHIDGNISSEILIPFNDLSGLGVDAKYYLICIGEERVYGIRSG